MPTTPTLTLAALALVAAGPALAQGAAKGSVPARMAHVDFHVDFFDELGSPGGASKVGRVEADPQWIKDLPPVVHDE